MIRTLLTLATALATGSLAAQTVAWLPSDNVQNYQGVSISPNGKYVAGYNAVVYTSETEYYGTNNGFIYDLSASRSYNVQNDELTGSTVSDVSNTGKAVGYMVKSVSTDPMAAPMTYAVALDVTTGKIAQLSTDASVAYAVSNDGTLVVGELKDGQNSKACYWKDGKATLLPLPTAAEAGVEAVVSSTSKFVSGDGSVILGTIVGESTSAEYGTKYKSELVTAWRLQADGTYKYDLIYKDIYDLAGDRSKPFIQAKPMGISDDGKWISLQTRGWFKTDDGLWGLNMADRLCRMNLETKVATEAVLDGSNDMANNLMCQPGGIANDGTLVGAVNTSVQRKAVIWKSDEQLPRYIDKAFASDGFVSLYVSAAVDITPDGKRIVGFGKTGSGMSSTFWIDTDNGGATGLSEVQGGAAGQQRVVGGYTLDGTLVSTDSTEGLPEGIYIVKTTDGKTVNAKKVVVKR